MSKTAAQMSISAEKPQANLLPTTTNKQPNAETLEAIAEIEQGKGQVFNTTQALFADWRH